ncbi:hypothetical protein GQ53DRAFT_130926 [Thozetella sp. PMI_491]|nr:hypothetical protein GQ53DRAFT_130926 [Thozetella sp. PMI_491]
MNLEFFLAKALHAKADFVFIFNGPTNDSTLIPNLPNVEVIQRENTCYDLGSFGDVLRQGDRWKNYKHFVTMNASVRGPFFPNFMKPCWTDMLAGRINDGIKLVGTTINCWPRPHLQSQMLATDDVGMSILLDPSLATSLQQEDKWGGKDDPVGLTACFQNRNQAVHSEIGITGLITSQGYGVDVTLSAFDVGSENLTTYCTGEKSEADPLVQGSYFGGSIHPYEVVFMKTNRHITEATMDIMTKWHLERSWSSWDACKL